ARLIARPGSVKLDDARDVVAGLAAAVVDHPYAVHGAGRTLHQVLIRTRPRPQEREDDEADDQECRGEEKDLDDLHAFVTPRPGRSPNTNRPPTTGTARNGSSVMRRLPSRSAHSTAGARCAAAAIATLVSAARQPSITLRPSSSARATIARACPMPPLFCSFTLMPSHAPM